MEQEQIYKFASAAKGGKKESYIHIHKFQVFPFHVLIGISSIWMLMKKVPDFSFASCPQQSLGLSTILIIPVWRIILKGKFSSLDVSSVPEK